MTTTRPGFIWSGTEWIAIGQEAVLAPVSYQATAPTSPATGDIWIESDVDVPSIDSAQFLRWRKTMTGGETSLSGNDDSSLPLQYTPGYEQLYINGVLQVRGGDYTATTGTTVTGLTALVANDVVEIFSAIAVSVADVYTQTQSDARFVNKTGGVLQTIQTAKSDTLTSSVGTNTDVNITGLTASISPSSTSSKVLVTVSIMVGGGLDGGSPGYMLSTKLKRNSTYVGTGNTAGNRSSVSAAFFHNNLSNVGMINFSFLDSPNTTSSVSYSVDFRHSSGATQTLYLNRSADDSDIHNRQRGISTITLQEIGA